MRSWVYFLVMAISALVIAVPVSRLMAQDGSVNRVLPSQHVLGNDQDVAMKDDKPDLQKIKTWRDELETIEKAVSGSGVSEGELVQFADQANVIVIDSGDLIDQLQPAVKDIQQQIDELGPPPEKGAPPESPDIKARRDSLNKQFAAADDPIKEAKLVQRKAQQLQSSILETRRTRFLSNLTIRKKSILNVTLWWDFLSGFEGIGSGLAYFYQNSYNTLAGRIHTNAAFLASFAGILALILLAYFTARDWLKKKISSKLASSNASSAKKSIIAFLIFLKMGVARVYLIVATYLLVLNLNVLSGQLTQLALALCLALSFALSLVALSFVYLRPGSDDYRLLKLSGSTARRLFQLICTAITIVVSCYLLNVFAVVLYLRPEVTIGFSSIFALIISLVTIRILVVIGREQQEADSSGVAEKGSVSWVYVKVVFWLAALSALFGLSLGYITFGEFISFQIVITTMVLGVLVLLLHYMESYKQRYLSSRSSVSREISEATGMSQATIRQVSVLVFGIAKLSCFVLAAMALLAQWGVRTADWFLWMQGAFYGFKVGGLTISISAVLLSIALFVIGYLITRSLKNWLENQYLPTTRLDAGLRNSIATMLGYLGIVIALMLAITAAGFNLSSLAIVAGALSVGIGFGLQSIVNNFVSGLILLAERPMRAGDWVVTSGGEGTVRKISVRSTEIETFDHAVIVVPNSTLIAESVTNWTLRNKRGRVIVTVGVGYDSDPEQVREILLDVAKANPGILDNPAPVVYFMDFGADALIFDLRCHLADIEYGISVRSELRFAIFAAFIQANINIPFPQRDLHIRSGLELLASDEHIKRQEKALEAEKEEAAETTEIPEQDRVHKARDT